MKKFTVGKDFDYLQGHLRYGHAEITVEAESEEEAKTKAEEYFANGDYRIIVDDFEIEDHGDLDGSSYIIKK